MYLLERIHNDQVRLLFASRDRSEIADLLADVLRDLGTHAEDEVVGEHYLAAGYRFSLDEKAEAFLALSGELYQIRLDLSVSHPSVGGRAAKKRLIRTLRTPVDVGESSSSVAGAVERATAGVESRGVPDTFFALHDDIDVRNRLQ